MRRAKGFTLLEVLIATTILASLTVIVAMLWAQTKQWSEEATTHGSALGLQRSLEMLDLQWEHRLVDASLTDGEPGAVRVDDSRLEFITTRGVLFPDWPIVKAAYIAEPLDENRIETTNDDATPWRLVYEETRLGASFGADQGLADEPATVGLKRSVLTRFESRPIWAAVLAEQQIIEWEDAHGLIESPTLEEGESRVARWIDLTENKDRKWAGLNQAINPEAVRITSTTGEGGFAWALVGQPLR